MFGMACGSCRCQESGATRFSPSVFGVSELSEYPWSKIQTDSFHSFKISLTTWMNRKSVQYIPKTTSGGLSQNFGHENHRVSRTAWPSEPYGSLLKMPKFWVLLQTPGLLHAFLLSSECSVASKLLSLASPGVLSNFWDGFHALQCWHALRGDQSRKSFFLRIP